MHPGAPPEALQGPGPVGGVTGGPGGWTLVPKGYRLNALWRDFWAHSTPRPNGCREWTRSTSHFGYGVLRWMGRYWYAHVVAWMKFHGPVPPGFHVLHECDNPPCVAPEHLYLGTLQQNAQDREGRSRGRPDKRHNGLTRITIRDALRARLMDAYGEDRTTIGAMLGLARSQVSNILTGKCWRLP